MNKLSAVICSTFRQEIDYLLPFMRREINTCSNSNCKPIFVLIFEMIEEKKAKCLNAILEKDYTKDQFKILINKEGKGFSSCLNYGILQMKVKYIFRLDTDDTSLPSRYDHQINLLEKNQMYLCYSDTYDYLSKNIIRYPSPKLVKSALIFGINPIPHITVCFNRAIFLSRVGIYNESLTHSEDFDLWTRYIISQGTKKIIKAKAPLVGYQTKESYKKSNKSALVQILIRLKYLRKTAFIIILSIGILPNLLRLIIPQKSLWLKYFIQKFGRN